MTAPDREVAPPTPIAATRTEPLGRWWLRNRWEELAFVHWAYEPDLVQALLPDGLRVDTIDGNAYVSLIPFRMADAAPRWLPAIPWLSSFAETNVRTYVVDSAGNRAIWFFSLEASRLPIVALARWALGFPYVWGDLSIEEGERDGMRWRRYATTRRRWPKRPASTSVVGIDIGERIAEPSDLDVFLTARWGTAAEWPRGSGTLRHHPVDHPEWELWQATLTEYHDEAITAAGLPEPTGDPIVRWSPATRARFARPTRV
ncbi:MAG: DUF2071 domain-containing protein [Actinomycetota bacterium]